MTGALLFAGAGTACGGTGSAGEAQSPDAAVEAQSDTGSSVDSGGLDVALQEEDGARDASDETSPVSDSGQSACPARSLGPVGAGVAQSAGFFGSRNPYKALFGVSCMGVTDCANACVAAGGTITSCTMGSLCAQGLGDAGRSCVPPSYWLDTTGALSASGMINNDAQLVLVNSAFNDALVLTDFGIAIPDDSVIVGIQLDVVRAAARGEAIDEAVQLMRGGAPVGVDHGQPAPWPTTLASVSYGGPNDTWGVSWTVADVRSK